MEIDIHNEKTTMWQVSEIEVPKKRTLYVFRWEEKLVLKCRSISAIVLT